MAHMRAILIKGDQGPIENLYVGQTPKPVPGEGEVLVKVRK
jgi:NADPH:quinone reductase-like Zn-dependent oxidoreductase